MRARFFVLLLAALLGGRQVRAQVNPFNPPPTPPEQEEKRRYQPLRYDEDWSFLRASLKQLAWWDPYKYVPLNEAGDWYLTLGGEIRERYELLNNPLERTRKGDGDGYLLSRYLLHLDAHLGSAVRVFGQLQSGMASFDEGKLRSGDEDRLDVHQFFVDLKAEVGTGEQGVTLRVGRQEMLYGSERMISVREGRNVRRAFDAVRALGRIGQWKVDAFLARPVEDEPGVFDDYPESRVNFWGAYVSGRVDFLKGAGVDVYYLGLDRPAARYAQGVGDEQRHSVGGRFYRKRDGWDWDAEGVFQWGQFGDAKILAWSAAGEGGYTFEDVLFKPRAGLRASVTSGNGASGHGKLGTFNPLFPKGGYFGEAALIGPENLVDVGPSLVLKLPKRVTVKAGWDFFWRQSAGDGIYDESGALLRGASGGAKFVGQQGSIGAEWEVPRHISIGMAYVHFFRGDFLKESGGGDVDFVGAWVRYRF